MALECVIFLPLSPNCWHYRYVSLSLVIIIIIVEKGLFLNPITLESFVLCLSVATYFYCLKKKVQEILVSLVNVVNEFTSYLTVTHKTNITFMNQWEDEPSRRLTKFPTDSTLLNCSVMG